MAVNLGDLLAHDFCDLKYLFKNFAVMLTQYYHEQPRLTLEHEVRVQTPDQMKQSRVKCIWLYQGLKEALHTATVTSNIGALCLVFA